MQIEIKLDEACKETKIIVLTDKITEEVNELIHRLSETATTELLSGFRDDTLELLEQKDIIRIYTENGKVFAKTADGIYTLRLRLYEAEERLDKKHFVRISNSEIINLKRVEKFDLSFTGTICVTLEDRTVTYVSRRYVAKIKQLLGI